MAYGRPIKIVTPSELKGHFGGGEWALTAHNLVGYEFMVRQRIGSTKWPFHAQLFDLLNFLRIEYFIPTLLRKIVEYPFNRRGVEWLSQALSRMTSFSSS